MNEFKEVIRKLYLAGYSERTIIRMVKDMFDSFRRSNKIV